LGLDNISIPRKFIQPIELLPDERRSQALLSGESDSSSKHFTQFDSPQVELLENCKLGKISPSDMSDKYENLLCNGEFSDFTFVCSDEEKIPAHKCILSIQCPIFAAMLRATMNEKKSNEAVIKDIDSETMTELLRFIYSRKVNEIEEINVDLFKAAEKYKIQELEDRCISSMVDTLHEDVLNILMTADIYDKKILKANCIDFIKW
jgi:BTB/POZ domain